MQLNLIKKDYPEMSNNDLKIIDAFIWNKCSEYYFIDYLRSTKGNVIDAIEFYKFDDDLRSVLTQFIIRFEIQIKTDFISKVFKMSKSEYIYKNKDLYLKSATFKKNIKTLSKYENTVARIESEYKKYKFDTPGPLNYVSISFCSFGSFQMLYKYINNSYKKDFIDLYTRELFSHDFKILDLILSSIKIVRNRCAHGNHVITLKLKNQLAEKSSLKIAYKCIYPYLNLTVFDCVIIYLSNRLTCSKEFKNKIRLLLDKYKKIIIKFNGRMSISKNLLEIFPPF